MTEQIPSMLYQIKMNDQELMLLKQLVDSEVNNITFFDVSRLSEETVQDLNGLKAQFQALRATLEKAIRA